jgi:ectoine hydroxylase-related dioxygenase (phytanoyl-CoA dioxygenase family)
MKSSNKNYQPFLDSLDTLGFCTFNPFEQSTIDQLQVLYNTHFQNQDIAGLYASHNANAIEKSLAISDAIRSIVDETLSLIFSDYRYFLGHFMVKGANEIKHFPLHQDWNIVDEKRYKSYQIWIPLQFTSPYNGGMYAVPKSHEFFNNYRSGSYGIPVVESLESVKEICTNIHIAPGGVLVYHNGLFHASHPNQSAENRIAIIVNYVQKKAPTFYFHKNEAAHYTELYGIDGDTLIENLPDLEKGMVHESLVCDEKVALSPIDNKTITAADLLAKYELCFGKATAAQIKQLHITKNNALEETLNRQGYAVVDMLDRTAVSVFLEKYNTFFPEIDETPGRFTTLQHTNHETKNKVHAFIVEQMKKPLDLLFKDYIIPVSQFYTKKAHTVGDIDLHADSTLLLNHQLEPHYAIWIPLVDVNQANGCLTVVPFSHKDQSLFYGGSFAGRQEKYRNFLRNYEMPIVLKAGQAIIFDNNLLHNSTANTTAEDRICFTFRMTHKSSIFYSFINEFNNNNLAVYLESQDYYMDENWDGEGNYKSGKFLGNLQNGIRDIDFTGLLNLKY